MNIELDIFENMLCFHKNGSNKNTSTFWTVTMIWIFWLLLMIKISDSKIRQHLKRVFQEDASSVSFL